jgi:hypothetical protein
MRGEQIKPDWRMKGCGTAVPFDFSIAVFGIFASILDEDVVKTAG